MILGITGGVGSGKTTVLKYFQEKYHAEIIEMDQVGKAISSPGQRAYQKIIDTFGSEIKYSYGEEIDRAKLSKLVFQDKKKLEQLNQIIHPLVKEFVLEKIKEARQKNKFLILESAILFEAGYETLCDFICYIYADETVRYQRLLESRGYTEEKTKNIIKNQKSVAYYKEHCDFIFDNSQTKETTYQQIDLFMKQHNLKESVE